MEIIYLIVGYLLGMIKIIYSLRFGLSCASSYLIMKLCYPNIHIWGFKEYNDIDNYFLFWNFEHRNLCIALVILSLCFFYWILPKGCLKLISNKRESKVKLMYEKLSHKVIIVDMIRKIFKNIFKFIFKYSPFLPSEKAKIEDAPTYNKFCQWYCFMFSTLIHISIVFLFVFNFNSIISYFLTMILIGLFLLLLRFIPFAFFERTQILNAVAEEYNIYVK